MAPERDWNIDPQFALRLGARLVQTLLGVAQLIEDASAASKEIRAFRGEADLAGRAVKQPRAEVSLERRDVPAGRRTRDIQLVGGAGKGSAVGHPYEHPHRKQLVHPAIVQKIRIT